MIDMTDNEHFKKNTVIGALRGHPTCSPNKKKEV